MAAPVFPPPLRDGDRLSRAEFMRRWEALPDLKRAELIDGVVHLPSPVSRTHDQHHALFATLLGLYQLATPGCRWGITGTWLMSENSAPQPDLTLEILPEFGGQARIEGEYSGGAPELIVEISHSTAISDSTRKLRLYERSGVLEYAIVHTKDRQITWYSRADGKFAELAADAEGIIRSQTFPGFWLDTSAFWDSDLAAATSTLQLGIAAPEHTTFIGQLKTQAR